MQLMNKINLFKRKLVAPLGTYPILKVSNASVESVLKDPEVQMTSLETIKEKIPTDMILSFMDLSVESEALGLDIEYNDKSSPQVRKHPIKNEIELAKLEIPDPYTAGRMPVYIKVQELMKQKFDIMTGSYIASPFTLAGLLMGAEDLAMNTVLKPDFCKKAIDFSADVLIPYAKALEKAGADFIVILDPTAVLVSPKSYAEFILPYNKKIIDSLSIPVILHTCGNTKHILSLLAQTGAEGLSLDAAVDMKEAAEILPKDIVIIGNLDPVRVFNDLTVEEVYQKAKELLVDMKDVKNFILSSGCDLPYKTPLENIVAFCNAALDEF